MRLIFTDPRRPRDVFVIHDRTDSKDPTVREGESFTVSDKRGRELLAAYEPRLQAVEETPKAKPGVKATPIVTVTAEKKQPERGGKRAIKA